jgi:hypothetical protein
MKRNVEKVWGSPYALGAHYLLKNKLYYIHNVRLCMYGYVIVIFMFDENVTFYQHVWSIVKL